MKNFNLTSYSNLVDKAGFITEMEPTSIFAYCGSAAVCAQLVGDIDENWWSIELHDEEEDVIVIVSIMGDDFRVELRRGGHLDFSASVFGQDISRFNADWYVERHQLPKWMVDVFPR